MGKKDGLSTGLLGAEVATPPPAPPPQQPSLSLSSDADEGEDEVIRTSSGSPTEPSSPRYDSFRPSASVIIQSERGEQVLARTLFDEAAQEAARVEVASKSRQKMMFAGFCLLEVVANFDAGLLPACEMHVSTEYGLAHTEAGLLGGLVYFGMVIGTPLAGFYLTNTDNQNSLMIVGPLLNSLSILMFATAPTRHFLFVGRTLMGISQGAIFVYAPVWVDEFSPESAQAMWMATLQGSVVLGIVLGYVVAGAFVGYWQPWTCTTMDLATGLPMLGPDGITALTHEVFEPDFEQAHVGECYNEHWKVGLYMQAACMMSFVLLFAGVDDTLVNSKGGERSRIQWRTRALYREAILRLNPMNIDASLRRMLENESGESAVAPDSIIGQMQKNLGGVLSGFSPRKVDASERDSPKQQKLHPAAAKPQRRPSIDVDLISMFTNPQETVGNILDVGEDLAQALGAGSMSGGGGIMESQGIMDLFGHDYSGGGGGGGHLVTNLPLSAQLGLLIKSSLYVTLTLALCGLYYVVTGTQFWITEYAQATPPEGLGIAQQTVLWAFSLTSVTAPTSGVFFGGWIIDQQGGYKDAEVQTMRTCLYFALGGSIAAIPAAWSTDFYAVMGGLWGILFFGGCMISPATGICINAVHADLRSLSSAMSMFAYNLLGYGAAPIIGGKIADMTGDIGAGYRSIVYAVFVAAGMFYLSYLAAKRAAEANPALPDGAVIELLKRGTSDSTEGITPEDLATLRTAVGKASPEQADMMAKWLAVRLQYAMGKGDAATSGHSAECAASTPVTLKSLKTIQNLLEADSFRRAVAHNCGGQIVSAATYTIIDPEYGDKPAEMIRKTAEQVSAALK